LLKKPFGNYGFLNTTLHLQPDQCWTGGDRQQ